MKILLVHNFYQQPGGEDVVFALERALLESHGHQVLSYTRSNDEAQGRSFIGRVKLLQGIVSASDSRKDIEDILRVERPDLVHIHNTFMMISPSVFEACAAFHIPTVQTLHNYRLICPAVTLYRDGHVCEECISHGVMRGVRYGCYRDSRVTTAAVALMLEVHRRRKTWLTHANTFIALTEFARSKFIEGGLPPENIVVKPNFVLPDPGERVRPGDYALFVGRLSQEKGLPTLLEAWRKLPRAVPLKIAGDGPERALLEAESTKLGLRNVEFLGRLSSEQTRAAMKGAAFLVMPSVWYEGLPLVIIEAFACGTPVIASRLGAMQELIQHERTGLLFQPGAAEDLGRIVSWAWEHPEEMAAMGRAARQEYEQKFTAERNYTALMQIYENAIHRAHAPVTQA